MEDLEVNERLTIPGWEMWYIASRSGGPGGQHANKTSSRVTLYWALNNSSVLSTHQRNRLAHRLKGYINAEGELHVSVDDERSQHRNRSLARERLAELVRDGLKRRKRRIPTRPTRASQRRRVENKRRHSRRKELRKNPDIPT